MSTDLENMLPPALYMKTAFKVENIDTERATPAAVTIKEELISKQED